MELVQIRPAQLDEFQGAARRDFEARAAGYLRRRFPDRWGAASDAEVAGFVRQSEQRAAEFGLQSEQAVVAVADIRSRVGDDWSGPEWDFIPRMLGDTKYEPNFRALFAAQVVHDVTAAQAGPR